MEMSLAGLNQVVNGELNGDPEKIIRGIAPFDAAGSDDITFADSPKILKRISDTRAGAVIVPLQFHADASASTHFIKSANPRLAFAKILQLWFPRVPLFQGISPQASIGQNVSFGDDVAVGVTAVIQDNVTIGSRTIIHPHAVIGDGVRIGDDVEIYPHVTILSRCVIGNRVIVHAGTVIGSDGFGFVPDGEKHFKIPQVGIVQIDDDVEIGACNTIDRATFGKTWIRQGVKTDNHVHIAHNVTVGENTLIVAQVGIAGSTKIGKNVTLAGQAGIGGHIVIGDHVTVGPQAGVTRSVPDGEVVSGTPEIPHRLWLRVSQIIPKLPELKKRIADMEKRLDALIGKRVS
jgi:UDP-3-O-[3-hydroxymyristoyl] glucosamine N-acyltransferase